MPANNGGRNGNKNNGKKSENKALESVSTTMA